MTLEQNLFYMSDPLKKKFETFDGTLRDDLLMFHVEVKPKFFCDEVPSFESIKEILDQFEKGRDIDQKRFYKKYFNSNFKKYVFRKKTAANDPKGRKKVLKHFDPLDFFDDDILKRTKCIKSLLKEDWGYLKIFDNGL